MSIFVLFARRWVGYEHTGYNGRQYILEEGEYKDSGAWHGSNDQLSSLKMLNPVSCDVLDSGILEVLVTMHCLSTEQFTHVSVLKISISTFEKK